MNQKVYQTVAQWRPQLHATGQLVSSIRLPYAPQFWIELGEAICNWLVRVLRMCEMRLDDIAYKEITINKDKVGAAISQHFIEFLNARGEPPARILMGRDYYYNLMGELYTQITFTANLRVYKRTQFATVEYNGVEVVCIPWMNGILALPDIT